MKIKKKKNKKKILPPELKKQLVVQYHVADLEGCGLYRCVYPCEALNHFVQEPKYDVKSFWTMRFNFDPNFYNGISYVVMQRPSTEPQLKILHWLNQLKAQLGFRVIYEIDDDIFNIPKYNPAHEFYRPLRENIKKVLGECDCLTTTTQVLADLYAPYVPKTKIVKNSLPKWLWGDIERRYDQEDFGDYSKHKFTIVWMGSALHFGHEKLGGDLTKDLFDFIVKTRDKYQWIFCGAVPAALQSYRNDIIHYPWKKMLEYPQHSKKIARKHQIDMGFAFVVDNAFNRAKSDIKRLEYTALGIPGVYSRLTPYADCSLQYSSIDELEGRIERLRTDPDYYRKVYLKEYNDLKNRLWIEDYVKQYFKFLVNNIVLETIAERNKRLEEERTKKQKAVSIESAVKSALNKSSGPASPFFQPGVK